MGVIVASIFHYFYNFTLFEFGLIISCSFIMDFDFLFSKFAKDRNHRMLITHSIIPGIIILIIGLIINWTALIISGFAYIIHIVIDAFDWGTNFFCIHKNPFGPKLLISKEELDNLPKILPKYKFNKSFFEFRYYNNKVVLIIEALLVILMIVFIIIFAFEYILISVIYIPFLFLHLATYYHLKKLEKS